jgi:hypothetical protein
VSFKNVPACPALRAPVNWRALFACESGLSEPEIGLELHAFVLLIWQKKHDKWVKWQNSHGARFAKTTANRSIFFCHFLFFLIRESASTAFDQICTGFHACVHVHMYILRMGEFENI